MALHYCTIIARNYAAQARVLAQSLLAQDPLARFSVLVLDASRGGDLGVIDPATEAFEIVTPDDLRIDGFEQMTAIYSVIELSTAVKPWLLDTLMTRPDTDRVVYLDPDIQAFTRLDELDRALDDHSIVLTPQVTPPIIRDDHRPNENDILLSGVYNLGFIAVREGDAAAGLLEYWKERADCGFDPPRGFFVDQRWIDFVPGLFEDCCILRDPGYNVACWNLLHRDIRVVDGEYLVNGRPLQFFHYSGYSPDRPDTASQHQSRVDLSEYPVVKELCDSYGAALLRHGYHEGKSTPYGYGALADGTLVTALIRDALRRAIAEGALIANVFTPEGTEQAQASLNGPPGATAAGAETRPSVGRRTTDAGAPTLRPGSLPVVVAGMHRSGTSMVARILEASGLYIGDQLMPGAPDNPEGFWEDVRFVSVNEDVLVALGGDWDDPPPAAAWADPPSLDAERNRGTALIEDFDRRAPWGWKDPRTSLTLRFWLELIPALKVVVCLRNPFEVSVSLQRRNGSSLTRGFNLWLAYNEAILSLIPPERRLITHYSAYYQHPHAELGRLFSFCGLDPGEPTPGALAAIRPQLRNSQFGMRDAVAASVPPAAVGLYLELCDEAEWSDPDGPLHPVAGTRAISG